MRILLFSLLLVANSFSHGQNGIRSTMAHFEMPLGNVKPNILLGYDKELRERFSIGIDLINSFEYAQRVVRFNG